MRDGSVSQQQTNNRRVTHTILRPFAWADNSQWTAHCFSTLQGSGALLALGYPQGEAGAGGGSSAVQSPVLAAGSMGSVSRLPVNDAGASASLAPGHAYHRYYTQDTGLWKSQVIASLCSVRNFLLKAYTSHFMFLGSALRFEQRKDVHIHNGAMWQPRAANSICDYRSTYKGLLQRRTQCFVSHACVCKCI